MELILCTMPRFIGCAALVATLLIACDCRAAKFNRKLDLGDAAPTWKDLPGTDGKPHALTDLKESRAVVVVFTRNHCPIASHYEERLNDFAKTYKSRGVALVAINASRQTGEDLEKMKKHAADAGMEFSYLWDEKQVLGQAYGATVTPQVFLLDAKRKVVYMGAFDDHLDPRQVTHQYLHDAVEALLSGKDIDVGETLPQGCPISYPRRAGKTSDE